MRGALVRCIFPGILLIWFAAIAAAGAASATIRFLEPPRIEIDYMTGEAGGPTQSLNLRGYGVTEKLAFLHGDLQCGTVMRSLLLRTEDGGRTWQEVLPGEQGSYLTHIFFLDELQGWALAEWEIEGWGDVQIYRTTDGGKNWSRVGLLPKDCLAGTVVSLQFDDANHGASEYECLCDCPREGFHTLTTEDGGATWNETRFLTPEQHRDVPRKPIKVEGTYDGKDGSKWRVEQGKDLLTVYRIPKGGARKVFTTIPSHVAYKDGQIHPLP